MFRSFLAMKNEKLYQSRNYLFLFRIDVSNEQVVEYARQVEKRRKDILVLLGCESVQIGKKPVYIIDKSENENVRSGKGNAKCIHIFISKLDDVLTNINLVIHEETHFLLFNMYPQISVFLNEGIAEYICWRYTNRDMPEQFEKNMKYIQQITSEMILSCENWMKKYSSQKIWIYGIACLYVDCIMADKYTIKEFLDEIYVKKETDIIRKTLRNCQVKYGDL